MYNGSGSVDISVLNNSMNNNAGERMANTIHAMPVPDFVSQPRAYAGQPSPT